MRIWDVSPKILCRNHLLGEHRELHAVWTILTENKKGYINHPETRRWVGKLSALYIRHGLVVSEMFSRGYRHNSSLNKKYATGGRIQKNYIDSIEKQKIILESKNCECPLD